MSIEISEKIKEHICYMENLNGEQLLDYCFTKYYEYENTDVELANYFFIKITRLNFRLGNLNSIDIVNKLESYQKNIIINACYSYTYDGMISLRGPIFNVLGEIFDNKVEKPFIEPYIELITMLLNKKEQSKISK